MTMYAALACCSVGMLWVVYLMMPGLVVTDGQGVEQNVADVFPDRTSWLPMTALPRLGAGGLGAIPWNRDLTAANNLAYMVYGFGGLRHLGISVAGLLYTIQGLALAMGLIYWALGHWLAWRTCSL